jgi:hypothetical protein
LRGDCRVITTLCLWLALAGAPGSTQSGSPARRFEEAITLVEARNCAQATRLLEEVARDADRPLAARALIYLGTCYEQLGDPRARQVYRRVLDDHADQARAASQARARLAALDDAGLPPAGSTRVARPLWDAAPSAGSIGRVSPDGRYLPFLENGAVAVYDLQKAVLAAPIDLDPAAQADRLCTPYPPLVLSRDADSVAYGCEPAARDGFEIRILPLRGEPRPRLALKLAAGEAGEVMEWRANQNLVVQVTTPDAEMRLLRVPLAPGAVAVTMATGSATTPIASLSPDSRWVAYEGFLPGSSTRMPLVSGGPSRIPAPAIAAPLRDRHPVWTADGRGLVFVSERTGTPGLWFQRVRDGVPHAAPELLFPDIGHVITPLALSEGGRYIYWREVGLVDVHLVTLGADGLPAAAPRNAGAARVGQFLMPDWSPDGRWLAFVARSGGLVVRDVAAGVEQRVAVDLSMVILPRWSPDGRQLLVRAHDGSGRHGLFAVNVLEDRTTAVKLVARNEESLITAGDWIDGGGGAICFFKGRLIRIDTASGEEQVLYEAAPPAVPLQPSTSRHDGSIVFVERAGNGSGDRLRVRNPAGAVREILAAAPGEGLGTPVWLPENAGVLFTRLVRSGLRYVRTIWRLDLETGKAQAIPLALEDPRDGAIHPNGGTLAFTAGNPRREPWMLEIVLPR